MQEVRISGPHDSDFKDYRIQRSLRSMIGGSLLGKEPP